MSVKMVSGPSIWEEWKEEDLEDLEPDSSGGEFGVEQRVVMISCGSVKHASCSQMSSVSQDITHTNAKSHGMGRDLRSGRKGSKSHARLGCRVDETRGEGAVFWGQIGGGIRSVVGNRKKQTINVNRIGSELQAQAHRRMITRSRVVSRESFKRKKK
jgi:hypothetical protein